MYRLAGFEAQYAHVDSITSLLVEQLGCTEVTATGPITFVNGDAVVEVSPTNSPRIATLILHTTDLGAAVHDLKSKGVSHATTPRGALRLTDPDGLAVEVRADHHASHPGPPGSPHLHHVSITTLDVPRSSDFYEQVFGLRSVYDYVEDDAIKLRFLADSTRSGDPESFLLELMGPPLLDREAAAVERAGGPCFDHYCFTGDDPIALHAGCLSRGCVNSEEPEHIEEFGLTLSYVFGPDDIEIELMDPLDLSGSTTS